LKFESLTLLSQEAQAAQDQHGDTRQEMALLTRGFLSVTKHPRENTARRKRPQLELWIADLGLGIENCGLGILYLNPQSSIRNHCRPIAA